MEVIALFSGLIRIIRICVGMVFDKEGFIRVVLDFVSASVKNASEIEPPLRHQTLLCVF